MKTKKPKKENEWSTVRIQKTTRTALGALGSKGQSYDDIIQSLVIMAESLGTK